MDNRGGMQIDLQCRAGCPWYMADAKQRDEGAKRGIELMHARLESSITEAVCICQENVIREENIMNEEIVLCAANSYEQKFYLNPEFDTLPENIRQELQIMCVLYTEDVGGILMLVFDENGNLELKVDHEESDFFFDEIGSVLKIKELQQTKRELFESLELFFRVFYLGEEIEDNSEE